jgi:hypothetical protein
MNGVRPGASKRERPIARWSARALSSGFESATTGATSCDFPTPRSASAWWEV